MSYIYDEGLIRKLRSWTKNTKLHIYSPEETKQLLEVIADETKDKPIELPIICLRRAGGYIINNINKKPTTYDGITLKADSEKATQLNLVPISIPYQLDIYTRYFKEADIYARNLIFNIINYPTFTVHIPHPDVDIEHTATVRLVDEVTDNSNVPERFIVGNFTRLTINLIINDANLWDARDRDVLDISIDATEFQEEI